MDTQGHEGMILQGAANAVRSRIPTVVEFWPYGMGRAGSYAALKRELVKYDQMYDLRENDSLPIQISVDAVGGLHRKYHDHWTDILLL
jgi:hypothetical protein